MKKTVKCSGCGKEHEIITLPHLHTGVSVDFKPVETISGRIKALCTSFDSVHMNTATTLLLGSATALELAEHMDWNYDTMKSSPFLGLRIFVLAESDHLEVR
jgi:hypothetical protein